MAPILSKQPLKALTQIGSKVVTPFYLAYTALRMSFKSMRQDPDWSLKMAVVVSILRFSFNVMTMTRDQLAEQKKAPKSGQYVRISPADTKLLTGVLTPGVVQPKDLPGVWFPSVPNPEAVGDEKIILYFPGGAFVIALESDFIGPILADGLIKDLGADRLLFSQYRLVRDEQTRFPAAIQDAVTFYSYVLSMGVKPSNIIISGDSAGGNVALGLLRYLESQTALPKPSALVAWSPWVFVPPDAGAQFTKMPNWEKDFITPAFVQWGAEVYRPGDKLEEDVEAIISPLHHPFETSVPIFLQAGGLEAFRDNIHEFANAMAKFNGEERVKYYESPGVVHDLVLMHPQAGLGELNRTAVQAAREFLESTQ